ncbi:MAG: DsrE family protein [Candidatus Xenobiia bacterium LiM19]
MSKLGFYLKSAPFNSTRGETVYHLALAALDKGIQVMLFLDLDGVLNTVSTQKSMESLEMPKDRFITLIEKGASVYICSTCLSAFGLIDPDLRVEGVKPGNMENLATMLSDVDRLVSL